MRIAGAGLAGLITAHVFQRLPIIEAAPQPTESHKALLRFRSTAVADLTGIEFKAVKVRKAIHDGEKEIAPSMAAANAYAAKCTGRIIDRSIWSLEPVTRYVAPETLYEQLIDSVGSRIHWNTSAQFTSGAPLISTAPLPIVCKALGIDTGEEFERAPITVARFRVPKCDVYQTVYFPFSNTSMYRASITGDLMIVEFVGEPIGDWYPMIARAFGVDDLDPLGEVSQKYGKIAPIDEKIRRALIPKLTTDFNIYSIGRFATWRNILLDDVVRDAAVVKKLLNADEHERRLISLNMEN